MTTPACWCTAGSCRVENTRAGQDVLRQAIVRRGVPDVLYADNGAPFANAVLARTCAVLGRPTRALHARIRPKAAGNRND